MMTKMTEVPEPIRAGLRKLLKAKGDDATLKILAASGTPTTHKSYELFVYYRKKSSDFDYLQMSVCYDMRMKQRITHFFRFMESENHPYRTEIFELFCSQLGDPDFKKMDFKKMWFTPAELTHLLSDARAAGRLESLCVGCFCKAFPEILFKHTTLTSLHFRSYATEIPVAIGQLTELTDLILHNSSITTLPISILNLQKLNNFDIAHYSFSAHWSSYHGTPQLTLSTRFQLWMNRFSHFKVVWIEA
jgi:Leucine-rich repeat (LRR) protein